MSIAGIPPFSGFFSKDEILVAAFEHDKFIFGILYFTAGLTAFYMFRLYYRIFWGQSDKSYHHTPHEAPFNMTFPLMFLAGLTVVFGFVPFGSFVMADHIPYHGHIQWSVASMSILVGVVGILIATLMYRKPTDKPDKVAAALKGLYTASYNKFWFDEGWLFVTKKIIFQRVSTPIAWFDRHVVDGFMNLLAAVTNTGSCRIKWIQSGELQDYVWAFYMGTKVIVVFVILL